MAYRVALTLKSANKKTGPIPVSTTTFDTCPDACPLQGAGCYAQSGPLAIFWRKVTEGRAGGSWRAFCDAVAALPAEQLWRHNQAGDLPGDRKDIDPLALAELVKANRGRRGFTYTHYPMSEANKVCVRIANREGFTVNLSANNPAHADTLAETRAGPVVTILPGAVHGRQTLRTPAGRTVVVCPATYRDDVTCASCGLCARQRDCIVGFPVHGSGARKANAIAAA